MSYTKPVVTIDLEEYQELLQIKDRSELKEDSIIPVIEKAFNDVLNGTFGGRDNYYLYDHSATVKIIEGIRNSINSNDHFEMVLVKYKDISKMTIRKKKPELIEKWPRVPIG